MGVASSSGVASGPVVAVIPAFNEERFIGSVVLTAKNYCDVVIVVDDGSSDRTAEVARAAGATVVQQPNSGKGAALNAGFAAARRHRPRATVILDGDAQHDPAEIQEVARPILEGAADVVIGSRFLTPDRRQSIPWWRQVGQVALTVATNSASGVRLTDSQTGYRAFSFEALQQLRFHSKGLSVESEMQFLLRDSSLRLKEVPIHVRYLDGNKRNPVTHGLSIVDTIIGLVARRRPLLFFSVPGVCLTLIGLFLGYRAFMALASHHIIPAGAAIAATLSLVVGLLFGVTGTILNAFEHFASRVSDDIARLSRAESRLEEEVVSREPIGRNLSEL